MFICYFNVIFGQLEYSDITDSVFSSDNYKGIEKSVKIADVNGDGLLDIVIASNAIYLGEGIWKGQPDRIWLKDPYSDQYQLDIFNEGDTTLTFTIDVGDIDKDGDMDIVCGNNANNESVNDGKAPNHIYINDGAGHFKEDANNRMYSRPFEDATFDIDLVDIDQDNDLDIFVCNNYTQKNRLWINDGTGQFSDETEQRLPSNTNNRNCRNADFGDIENDGDIDILLGNVSGMQDQLWINNGQAVFTDETENRLPAIPNHTHGVCLIDLDGDSDLDAVTCGEKLTPNAVYFLENDGSGFFADKTSACLLLDQKSFVSPHFRDINAGDLDVDGDVDLFITGLVENQNHSLVLENLGNNSFQNIASDVFQSMDSWSNPQSAELADLDGDEDLDLYVAVGKEKDRLLENTRINTSVLKFDENASNEIKIEILPNPFNESLKIYIETEDNSDLTISILNIRGQEIQQLNHLVNVNNTHYLEWNRFDDTAGMYSSGLYFLVVRTTKKIHYKKIFLLR